MQRNMDLIRNLMLALEAMPMEMGDSVEVAPGYPQIAQVKGADAEIEYHLDLLRSAGFLHCTRGQPMIGVMIKGLTWTGHDFVDSVRSEDTWTKTKSVAHKAGGWTVSLLIDIAKSVIKAEVGKHLPGL